MRNTKGFTLLEVMVTTAIFAILIAAGLPQLGTWVQLNQMNSRASTVATMLRAARSEALTRNNSVTLATDGAAGDWAGTITMYMDTSGGNDGFDLMDGDDFIQQIDLSTDRATINGNDRADSYISFSGDGRLDEAGQSVVIAVCNGVDTTNAQLITVNIVGRVSVSDTVTDCTP